MGKKAYTFIHRAMRDENLHGIAQLVLANREQLMLLRPVDELLTLTDLHYAAEIREPRVFSDEVDKADYKPNERGGPPRPSLAANGQGSCRC